MALLKDFAHLQIPLDDVLSATDNFSDENFIREGGFGRIYKGKLLRSGETIDIVARRLHSKYGQGNKEFLTEVTMLSDLKHENLVSLIGFCDQDGEKIIINKYEHNSSLDKYLSDPAVLTWRRRLEICLGVARALRYIHFDERRDYSIIHRNIKSSKILLDDNWTPKLSGFEHSIKTPAARRRRLVLAEVCGTYGYLDPAYEKTGGVTHKSDIFSLGVVLFEVLCGRRAFVSDERSLMFTMKSPEHLMNIPKDGLLSQLAKSRYEEGKLDDMINPDLRKQMQQQSYKIFSETAYYCLKEIRTQRPDIEQIVERLERALKFQLDHERSIDVHEGKDTSSNHSKAPSIANYSFLSQNPPAIEQLPFLFSNPQTNQANGDIMSFSLHEFAHLQIPLEDILSATNNFADKSILVHGGHGKLYKGQLKRRGESIDIVARKLEVRCGQGEIELWTEISMLSSLKHKNLVSIFGFCDENGEKIIIYKYSGHGCLYEHVYNKTLTWRQRLQICLGIAHALNHIHYDVVHGDINISNVLIDDDWEAKVYGFGLSTKFPGNWEHRLIFSHYFDTADAYRDPVYTNTQSVTPKYDVYAFGVLLYDVLCGNKPKIKSFGVTEKLDEMINADLRKQVDTQSLTSLSKTAYYCLSRQCVQRPSMDQIVEELEKALELPKPENPECLTLEDEATTFNHLTKENIERLRIPLTVINSATKHFKFHIGSGGYGKVYKAELDHLDIQNISSLDWKNKNELPKKRSTVAIKRIVNKEAGEEGFRAEIETLASCNHPNIVSLLGFSSENNEMILVFEFALKGSLVDCFEKNRMANVTWAKRLQICLDVARGLNYLHANLAGKRTILHRDVKSANILLGEKWNAKVADFGLSKFNPAGNTLMSAVPATQRIVGTPVYTDPEFLSTGTYAQASDIYSYGIVLFEILSGRMAYDSVYYEGNDKGLATVARRRYKEGTIKELIDPDMMEEANEHIFTINKGPNPKSLDTFTKIAHQCLSETQKERPKMEAIIKELEDALCFQRKTLVLMKFHLSDIVSATKKFSAKYCIGVSAYGMMYNAKLDHYDSKTMCEIEGKNGDELPKRSNNVALKRIFNREGEHGKQGFFAEIDLLAKFKHPNIVSLLGVASENREMIIIYEDSFKGSLHDCLGNARKMAKLTWAKRIQISLDIAHGLNHLQTSTEDKHKLIQFAMNSANILLNAKWRAKIACFWLSILYPANKEADILSTNNIVAKKVRSDPEYIKIEELKKESGVYSFGVILFEILCGRFQYDEIYYAKSEKGLPTIARQCVDEGTMLKEMVDAHLKEEIDEVLNEEVNQDSFDAFLKIAYGCCAVNEEDRPSMEVIIKELENALNIQVAHLKHLKSQVVEKVKDLEYLKIPLKDIRLATKNFSKQYSIGYGGFSEVFKAKLGHFDGIEFEGRSKGEMLRRHSTVAIKRLFRRQDEYAAETFFAELQALGNCNHPNIVSLLGFCHEDDEMIIVLEYASNQSLDTFLGNPDNMINLTWAQRIQICLDIAHGLCYIHTGIEDKQTLIHRDVKSENILLNDNMVAKIADFGLCKLNHAYGQFNSCLDSRIAGTKMYIDPEYMKTGRLKKASDIYSFGVVLFEIMCGRIAYDPTFNEEGLPPVARKCFEEGTLKQIRDPRMREDDENMFMLNGGLNQDSLDTFSKIAYQCLAERQEMRPTIQEVLSELEKAYNLQKNNKDKLQILLESIQLMTENFSDRKCIGEARYWKQYEGEVPWDDGYITVVAKRFDSKFDKQRRLFLTELETLVEYKHENIIGVVGYCQDMDERIIAYEHAPNGRLSEHMVDTRVTWMKRLKICIGVASGLHFLHTGGATKDMPIMHRDIKSACILLDGDWAAKISNLELSLNSWEREEIEHVSDNAYGSLGYLDPEYEQLGYLTLKSDIYSLGVVLLEMLCGRLERVDGCEDLSLLAKQFFTEGKLDELVFEGIKGQIDPESLAAFVDIALRCLRDDGAERPEAGEVVTQLNKAAEFQEDNEIWEPKLPRDYEEILRFSEIDLTKKKDIYNKLLQGVPLRDREVCLSLGSNGEKLYMISAKKFSYRNRWALNWRHIPESRFENVAEMSTLLSLNIKIKIRTWFLSPGVNYGVHLVFKFCGPRNFSAKNTYVNLTYKLGSQTFHAYFATWRDEEWMMIELYRFLNHEENTNFEVLLESFSSYYCGRGAIYVEGIEFRVVDNVKYEEIEKIKDAQEVLKSISNESQLQQLPSVSEEILSRSEDDKANKLFLLNEVSEKKQLMLSAKEVLYDLSNEKHFHLKPSTDSRFQEVIELQGEQVLRINCKIESQMLSKDTKYSCHFVFKLSKNCGGLHCPVKVRDALNRRNKEVKNAYLRSPSPWNSHDFNHIPKEREDGWMEVNVWSFNSNHNLKNDFYQLKLKLISYEGTMTGLIVCGLEFRPM